jgi:hypothetical protein
MIGIGKHVLSYPFPMWSLMELNWIIKRKSCILETLILEMPNSRYCSNTYFKMNYSDLITCNKNRMIRDQRTLVWVEGWRMLNTLNSVIMESLFPIETSVKAWLCMMPLSLWYAGQINGSKRWSQTGIKEGN